GVPLSELVHRSDKSTITVVEVSSFQLERIVNFRPFVAVITNISPDHLDRYNGFDDYRRAKLNILKNQTNFDYSILNMDDENLSSIDANSRILYFSMKKKADVYFIRKEVIDRVGKMVFSLDDLFIPGDIFVEDGMAASLIAKILGLSWKEVQAGIRSFKGVEHRMETVLKQKELHIINNSMCTNPCAFSRSLEAFPHSCVIVGGRMKVVDTTPIIEAIRKWAAQVILLGESSRDIERTLKEVGFDQYKVASSMMEAVKLTRDFGNNNVMLSPGGSSFDLYENFAERGEDFKKAVRTIYG
ncbi:UDP-N-acetylmuramoyl-L-alanine--D-glutamate ligase, partial [bacterium]|nr:UDP-N-acetylmuramoyl-L-alanine--D-glutamate ligase [bacterium]